MLCILCNSWEERTVCVVLSESESESESELESEWDLLPSRFTPWGVSMSCLWFLAEKGSWVNGFMVQSVK